MLSEVINGGGFVMCTAPACARESQGTQARRAPDLEDGSFKTFSNFGINGSFSLSTSQHTRYRARAAARSTVNGRRHYSVSSSPLNRDVSPENNPRVFFPFLARARGAETVGVEPIARGKAARRIVSACVLC